MDFRGFDSSIVFVPTKILDFRGLESSMLLILRGGILSNIRELPGKFESTNLGRENLSREIGRTGVRLCSGQTNGAAKHGRQEEIDQNTSNCEAKLQCPY